MPERTIFHFRYAIPGFTFVLLIIGINYVPILNLLANPRFDATFGAFIGFVTLLSGSAIGFLVCQVWWVFHISMGATYGMHAWKPRKAIQTLIDRYGLTRSRHLRDKRKVITVYDYIIHSETKLFSKELFEYRKRRWDMFHLLASEFATVLSGLVMGCLLRFVLFPRIGVIASAASSHEIIVLGTIAIVAVLLIVLLGIGIWWANLRYDAISEAIIKGSTVTSMDLLRIFPRDYFDQDRYTFLHDKK